MKKRVDIYHIYWGTAGNAGLYLDEIYKTLEKSGYRQKIYVSYYYPFDYGEKIFFKYTEMGHCKVNIFRGYFRFLELLWALLRIFIRTIIDRPQIINYSMIGGFAAVRFYLWLSKKVTGAKIVLTCHDVLASESSLQGAKSELENRKKIFRLVDVFLVHNEFSKTQLKDIFNIDNGKIVMHPFPIMDLKKIIDIKNSNFRQMDFLFLGHLRKEKGIDVLLNAWDIFHEKVPTATLRIAGNLPKMERINTQKYKERNDVEFILKFLNDDEYCKLIKSTRYVVLPYKRGTNSGVISTVLSLGADVITSNIQMFLQNPLVKRDLVFNTENADSLATILEYAYNKESVAETSRINEYRFLFEKEVNKVYAYLTTLVSTK